MRTDRKSRKVVLFLPPYSGGLIGPPLNLLSLASPLRDAGFEARIIDGALHANYQELIEREIEDCLVLGISLLTGPMIHSAIGVATRVKKLRPDLPVIFGGWHPTLLPGQTLNEDYVDIVVLHQGELTLLEIAQRLSVGSSLDLVPGCWFKRQGRMHQNPDRPRTPLSKLPRPAYDLVDFDAYEDGNGERTLPYATSLGCPYACNYCTDSVYYNRRFHAYDAQRVAEEMTGLAAQHRLRKIALVDSNFLVNTRRAADIARSLTERRSSARFEWTFQASTDLLCRMDDEDVEMLAASGVSHIGFGTESASEPVLRKMNKQHQHVGDMYEAARKCKRAGIRVTYNLIFGYPGETAADRCETLRIMSEIGDRFDNVSFSPNIFTPYPGIPIWPELRRLGLKEPQTLADWASIDLGSNQLPWLQDEAYRSVQRGVAYFLLNRSVVNAARRKYHSTVLRTLLGWFRRPLAWRVRKYSFALPIELWVAVVGRWLIMRRSLLTGKDLSRRLQRAG